MNDREKLIALLVEAESLCAAIDCYDGAVCEYAGEIDGCAAFRSDHLIAHGVVVREWIPVTERLPENSRYVLICRATGRVSIGHIPLYGAGVDVSYWYKDGLAKFHDVVSYRLVGVTHWMPLPEPPKEGE